MNGKITYFINMKPIKDIVLIKGRKKGSVYLQDITVDDIRAIFFPKDDQEKYKYLGVTWNIFREGSDNYKEINKFIKICDKYAKPDYYPRWFLRLLHLFGNDNSIVRVRNWRIHKLHNRLTGGIMIQDIKTKYDTLRIYGSFPEDILVYITKVENKVNPTLTPY